MNVLIPSNGDAERALKMASLLWPVAPRGDKDLNYFAYGLRSKALKTGVIDFQTQFFAVPQEKTRFLGEYTK